MKILCILTFVLWTSTGFTIDFLKVFPVNGSECAASATLLNSGKLLSAGVDWSTGDIMLYTFAADGAVQKAQRIQGPLQEEATSTIATKDGGTVIVGGTTSFSHGSTDGFIIKLRRDGTKAWAKTFGTSTDEFFARVLQMADAGFVVLGGITNTTTSFDVIVAKFSSRGKMLWKKTFSTTGFDHPSGMALTPDGGIVVIIASDVSGGTRTVVSRLNAQGAVQWTKIYGSSGTHVGLSISAAADGTLYLTEIYTAQGSQTSATVLSKLDPDGIPIWSKLLRIRKRNFAAFVQVQSDQTLLLSGNASTGSDDAKGILIGLNSNGQLLWRKRFNPDARPVFVGSSESDAASGSIYVAGCAGHNRQNDMDTFVLKLQANGQFQGGCSKLAAFPLSTSKFQLNGAAFTLQELSIPYATSNAGFTMSNFSAGESVVCSGE